MHSLIMTTKGYCVAYYGKDETLYKYTIHEGVIGTHILEWRHLGDNPSWALICETMKEMLNVAE